MSWFELITTQGRWLRNVEAEFRRGEFKVSWVTLKPGEEIAVLIDRHSNMAHLNRPLGECQILAAQHGYELALPRKREESFVERIEKVLGSLNTATPKGPSLCDGHEDVHGGVADARECPEPGGGSPACAC